MKICAIICEYNPFHNGHLHQLRQAKLLSGADAVLCLMSGNFVQRGESAILDKFTRAKHALLAGADVVIELPTPFACSSAEIFAKGAVKLLASIPSVTHLCFGAENANKQAFIDTATSLLNESDDISKKIKIGLAKGLSFAKARAQAYDNPLLSSPNNILGVEYTKAILQSGQNIEILPIQRIGSGYLDKRVDTELPSASAIREALITSDKESIFNAVPSYVYEALPTAITDNLDSLEKAAILQKSESEISTVLDCNEGLENALKKAA
ncbi:MAG: nucleotidyltransferase family protein, partial [Clostridia bacterium]|nr:nucleotidyltransferase family protein [Clostridia bacterium]